MKLVLALLCVVGVVYGQVPRPCLAPPLWEGKIVEIDPSKKFETRARVAYDAYNERFHSIEEVNLNDKKEFYSSLFLHKERKEYNLNLKTGKCTSKELTRPFHYIGIPENATFYGETIIGSLSAPGEGVTVQLWGGTTSEGSRYAGTWTVRGCIPVHDSYFSEHTGFISTSFFDVVAGIHDPEVFIPPKECL
ncbi:ependymin-like protein precursor [Saccoglossus kowalevskii]|uniref:Ependymin-like protein n=1 Tax=Saccoglossus kowalevskii TaxID=10224 RepID=D2XMR9_SACKO|nr:ependymin-like protein precursor [Saccoglossus kowalevskii]ADB22406.1 ependymin-like protein [Saccoglossus kowalevskii]